MEGHSASKLAVNQSNNIYNKKIKKLKNISKQGKKGEADKIGVHQKRFHRCFDLKFQLAPFGVYLRMMRYCLTGYRVCTMHEVIYNNSILGGLGKEMFSLKVILILLKFFF